MHLHRCGKHNQTTLHYMSRQPLDRCNRVGKPHLKVQGVRLLACQQTPSNHLTRCRGSLKCWSASRTEKMGCWLRRNKRLADVSQGQHLAMAWACVSLCAAKGSVHPSCVRNNRNSVGRNNTASSKESQAHHHSHECETHCVR